MPTMCYHICEWRCTMTCMLLQALLLLLLQGGRPECSDVTPVQRRIPQSLLMMVHGRCQQPVSSVRPPRFGNGARCGKNWKRGCGGRSGAGRRCSREGTCDTWRHDGGAALDRAAPCQCRVDQGLCRRHFRLLCTHITQIHDTQCNTYWIYTAQSKP